MCAIKKGADMTLKQQVKKSSAKNEIGYLFSDRDLEKSSIDELIDTPIYRIFPIGRFIQVLTAKELTLVKPKKWDDPFENALLSSDFIVGGETAVFSAKDSVYGQCWTLHRETDAMWRIYSPRKDGVRLMTTPRKLLAALKSHVGQYADVKCFIGKVQYKKKSELLNVFGKINILSSDGSGIARSLIYKRPEFSHEREVRLIYNGDDNNGTSDIFSFEIDYNKLFDRVLFDPRMEESLRRSYISAIKDLGCTVGVKRSTLYDAPKGLKFKLDT
jgi:hypothetical protein